MSLLLFQVGMGAAGSGASGSLTPLAWESWSRAAALNASSSGTSVLWDTAGATSGGGMRDGTNTDRFNVPTGASFAVVSFKAQCSAGSTGDVTANIKVNGTTVRTFKHWGQYWGPFRAEGVIPVSSGDYITFEVVPTATYALYVGQNITSCSVRVF